MPVSSVKPSSKPWGMYSDQAKRLRTFSSSLAAPVDGAAGWAQPPSTPATTIRVSPIIKVRRNMSPPSSGGGRSFGRRNGGPRRASLKKLRQQQQNENGQDPDRRKRVDLGADVGLDHFHSVVVV